MGRKLKKVYQGKVSQVKEGMADKELKEILSKYKGKISEHIEDAQVQKEFSKDYEKFRQEALSSSQTSYEKWCARAESLIKFRADPKARAEIEQAIETAHLNITAQGAASFAALVSFGFILLGLLYLFIFAALSSQFFTDFSHVDLPLFFPLLFLILGFISLKMLAKMPVYLASQWRLKASNQMVLCILYVVIYMRHTSNLENAIRFATEHVGPPLSVDLRKIFWDIETRKFSTIKESLDHYLESWRHYNLEFVTAFHLIESSLYEPSEARRLELLDKSLSVILDGTYEKMLHYAQELKNPITTLHMLGVILPILGLVIFPLVGSFLNGLVQWYHLAFLYNVLLPLVVFGYGMNVLAKRPTGYSESRFAQTAYRRVNPLWLCMGIGAIFMIIGLFPLIIHFINPTPGAGPGQCGPADIDLGLLGCFLDYQQKGNQAYGPFGLGALVLSFCIPFGLAFGIGLYYRLKSKNVIALRDQTKSLEKEYAAALFQLGNRIGDGVPPEIAFNKVALTLEGTPTGNFFAAVDKNIRVLGMNLREAIFNEKTGAILLYPSPLVESSMEILIEASQKGPKIVSQSLVTISNYVESINRVNERLKDLMSEIVSSMKSQISLMTPAIAGIVVGISAMIVAIIVSLNVRFAQLSLDAGPEALGAGGVGSLVNIFGIEGIIPGFFFQVVVGIYVVQLGYILTKLQNGIENGQDPVMEEYLLGRNMYRSVFLYVVIALAVSVIFYLLANQILSSQTF